MRNRSVLRTCLLFVFSLVTLSVNAQESFRLSAQIRAVSKSGFYRISLQPELIAKCRADLADLRLSGAGGDFIPYITASDLPLVKDSFIEFPIRRTAKETDSTTSVTVENNGPRLITSLWIKLRNTAVSRSADLMGSDDQVTWYAIAEGITIQGGGGGNTASFVQSFSFPPTNYRYLKLTVNNRNRSPLNVLKAGIYDDGQTDIRYLELPAPEIAKTGNREKGSRITLRFNDSYQVDRLTFAVSYPAYFKRRILVYEVKGADKRLVTDTYLRSDADRLQLVFSSKNRELEVEIQNGDNPPLEIDSIRAWQSVRYATAYLEAGKSYHFLFGDEHAKAPGYDLSFFTGTALKSSAETTHLAVDANPLFSDFRIKEELRFSSLLWIAAGGSIVLLSFLCWKMLKEMKKRSAQ